MESWNKAYEQLIEAFRSMTVGAQITAGLLLAMVVISLVFLFRFQEFGGATEHLFGDRPLTGGELDAIEGAFSTANLEGWQRSGNYIKVPRNNKPAFIAALVENRALPANPGSFLNNALEKESSFGSSHRLNERLKIAQEQELSLVFSAMKAVDWATVTLDEEKTGGFSRQKEKTAHVAVRPAAGETLNSELVQSIQRSMAGMVAGLHVKDVTVLDVASSVTHSGIDEDAPGASGRAFAKAKAEVETYYRQKIGDIVGMIPGVVLAVEATLDPTLDQSSSKVVYDTKPTTLKSLDTSKSESTTIPDRGGRPGAASNGVGNSQQVVTTSSQQTQRELSETSTDESRVAGHEYSVTDTSGLSVKRITSTVRIPRSYYASVWEHEWKSKNPDAAPEDIPGTPSATDLQDVETRVISDIQDSITAILPAVPPGDDKVPLVTVTSFQDFPVVPPAAPTTSQTATSWLATNWQTIALAVVALFSLAMLRGMVRSSPTDPAAVEAPPPNLRIAEEENEEEDQEANEGGLRKRPASDAPTLKMQLAEMVQSDPDAAANVLKNWIGDAA